MTEGEDVVGVVTRQEFTTPLAVLREVGAADRRPARV